MLKLIDDIIGHLGAAQVQHSASLDDDIIARHVADALTAAKKLRVQLAATCGAVRGVLTVIEYDE